jgi:hypothetical protein
MVLGIIGLFAGFIPGILAIVLGSGAKRRIRSNPATYGGGGMATAGIVLGIIDTVIGTIVGILVVVAAVMLIEKPKTSAMPPINTERFARNMESRLQKFEDKVAQVRAELPGAPAEQWQKIADGIATVRQILAEMPGITEDEDLQVKVDSANKAYLAARKTLKEITGQDASSDSTGGE